ncbi:MAG: hypothetical protein NWQ06_04925, partial [Leeuwenhoekiella sp.]|nr:hypothetical protein [Leeuwenhoekiella sp.]
MTIISFLAFTILVALVSWLAVRKQDESTSDGYFLGGRSLTAGVIAGSLLLTNLSTEQIVGLNGSAYKDGLSVMAWETLAAISIVVTAIFLLLTAFIWDYYNQNNKDLTKYVSQIENYIGDSEKAIA